MLSLVGRTLGTPAIVWLGPEYSAKKKRVTAKRQIQGEVQGAETRVLERRLWDRSRAT